MTSGKAGSVTCDFILYCDNSSIVLARIIESRVDVLQRNQRVMSHSQDKGNNEQRNMMTTGSYYVSFIFHAKKT